MRVLLKHAIVAQRALRSAELSNKLGEAICIQGSVPTPCALSLRCLHASAAASAPRDDDTQNGNVLSIVRALTASLLENNRLPISVQSRLEDERWDDFTGNKEDNGNRLPENATAKEMRQWADRMLGHSAQKASLTGDTISLHSSQTRLAPIKHV